jgi:fluoride exporter
MTILAVAAGGAIGAVARYLLAVRLYSELGLGFPWGTLGVNILGSALLGVVIGLVEERSAFTPEMRSFLTVGVLGGFTTFSTFAYESWEYLRDGDPGVSALYIAMSVVAGLAAFTAGHASIIILER